MLQTLFVQSVFVFLNSLKSKYEVLSKYDNKMIRLLVF